jgi:preprotein translocase subunit YajC
MPSLDTLFPLILIGGMVVFMVLSGRKRKAQATEMATKVVTGAKVMLSSGIYGEISSVTDDRITLVSAGSTKLEVAKGAVIRVVENAPAKKAAAKSTASKKPAVKK